MPASDTFWRITVINLAGLVLFVLMGVAYHSAIGTILYWLFNVAGFPWFSLADSLASKNQWIQNHLFNFIFNWVWYGGIPIFINSIVLECALYIKGKLRAA